MFKNEFGYRKYDLSIFATNRSPELKNLLEDNSQLLCKENYPICSNTEQNFIRALLVKLHQEKFQELFTSKLYPIPKTILKPINVRSSVKFISQLGKKEKLKAKRVLMKPSIGWNSGLVISGPYTGLILNFNITLGFINRSAVANRMIDNKQPRPTDKQYNIKIHDLEHKMKDSDFKLLVSELQTLMQQEYSDWLRSNPELRTVNDHIECLCEKLKI